MVQRSSFFVFAAVFWQATILFRLVLTKLVSAASSANPKGLAAFMSAIASYVPLF
ncbi:MAG: hypothetical protein KGJ79_15260 [Alphaproteobacteria bacterium]|nr:hypothetical protein [Alphaproteobacteria bacterium]